MRSGLGLVVLALGACGPRSVSLSPPSAAGDHHDDGAGILARASYSLVTSPDDDAAADDDTNAPARGRYDELTAAGFGGLGYGGALYGGLGYGGLAYNGAAAPGWGGGSAASPMTYDPEDDLTGAIEGVVTWQGALPARVTTTCGAIDNPTVHVGRDRGVGGALVYIAEVEIGRVVPTYAKQATVGGAVAKHGCALLPAAQIVAPLPATLTIHGDATAAKLHATAPTGVARAIELEEGGQAHLDALEGVVRIDSDDGKLAPAWVLGLDTPYYAITDDAGRFRIDELAAGTYDVAVWQAPVATSGTGGVVAYGAPIVVHRKVTVELERTARMNVALKP